MYEELAWVAVGIVVFWLVNRLLTQWLISRAVQANYRDHLERVLYSKENQVKGRFE